MCRASRVPGYLGDVANLVVELHAVASRHDAYMSLIPIVMVGLPLLQLDANDLAAPEVRTLPFAFMSHTSGGQCTCNVVCATTNGMLHLCKQVSNLGSAVNGVAILRSSSDDLQDMDAPTYMQLIRGPSIKHGGRKFPGEAPNA